MLKWHASIYICAVSILLTIEGTGATYVDDELSRKSLQLRVNYTTPAGDINCDGKKVGRPRCVNGLPNTRMEPLPFDGSGACDDVIRTMSLLGSLESVTLECEEEAVIAWSSAKGLHEEIATDSTTLKFEEFPVRTEWTDLHVSTNYTVPVPVTGLTCYILGETLGVYDEVFFPSKTDVPEKRALACFNDSHVERRINCDPSKVAKPSCDGTIANRKYEPLPFDGTGACEDVVRTINALSQEALARADETCEDEVRRRRLDYVDTCSSTRRFTYHFWFYGHCLSRTSPAQGTDVVMHNHLHNAQDNHRQFVGPAKQYVPMSGFALWQRAAFTEGNWIDTYENSHVYSCASQSTPYVHVKGHIRGQYLAYSTFKGVNPANTCSTVTNYRPAGAPTGARMFGVVDWENCFMDIDYSNSHVLTTGLGARSLKVRNAWNP